MTTTRPAITKQYQSKSHHCAYMAAYITKALYKHQLTLSTMLQSVIISISEMRQQGERQKDLPKIAQQKKSSRV